MFLLRKTLGTKRVKILVYTGNLKEENVLLVAETKNKVLEASQDWARISVGSLSEESQARVEKLESAKTLRFGGGERRKSIGFLENSMQVGWKKCHVGN